MKKYIISILSVLVVSLGLYDVAHAAPSQFFIYGTSTPGCIGVTTSGLLWSSGSACGTGSGGSGSFPFTPVAGGNATTSLLYLYGGLQTLGSTTLQFASTTNIESSGSAAFATAGGKAMIGTTTSTANGLEVYGTTDPLEILITSVGAVSGNFTARRANGTAASPTQAVSGDNLFTLRAMGWTSTNVWSTASALIKFTASESFTGTARGTDFIVQTTKNTTTNRVENFRVNNNGFVGIGQGGTTTPWGQLSVDANALGSGIPEFVIGSSTATHFKVDGNGTVTIATTTEDAGLAVGKVTLNPGLNAANGVTAPYIFNAYTSSSPNTGHRLADFQENGVTIFRITTSAVDFPTSGNVTNTGGGTFTFTRANASSLMSLTNSIGPALSTIAGGIGVGSSTISQALGVQGNVLISGDITSVAAITATSSITMVNGQNLQWTNGNNAVTFDGTALKYSTGGTVRMRTTSTGTYLGGDVNAVSKLDVAGGASIGSYAGVNAAPSNGLIVSGNVGIGTTSPGQLLSVAGDILGNVHIGSNFVATSSTATSTLKGPVSVGTLDPVTHGWGMSVGSTYNDVSSNTAYGNLYLFSTDSIAVDKGGVISLGGSYTGTTNTRFAAIKGAKEDSGDGIYNGYLAFYTRTTGAQFPAERARITSTGALGIGSTTPWGQLSVNPSALGSGVPEFVIGSTTRTHFLVDGAGNVGIGTTSPGALLSVGASAASSGGVYISNTGIGIGTTTPGNSLSFGVNGGGIFNGTVYATNFIDTALTGTGCVGEASGLLGANSNCVSSISSPNSTLTVSSPTGNVTIDVNLAHANKWTALQEFNANASTTELSAYRQLDVGGAATTTIKGDSATSTFSGGVQSTYLNLTGNGVATSTAASGFDLAGGCYAINHVCVGGGAGGSYTTGATATSSSVAMATTSATLVSGFSTYDVGFVASTTSATLSNGIGFCFNTCAPTDRYLSDGNNYQQNSTAANVAQRNGEFGPLGGGTAVYGTAAPYPTARLTFAVRGSTAANNTIIMSRCTLYNYSGVDKYMHCITTYQANTGTANEEGTMDTRIVWVGSSATPVTSISFVTSPNGTGITFPANTIISTRGWQ